jgi:hypothetical protein
MSGQSNQWLSRALMTSSASPRRPGHSDELAAAAAARRRGIGLIDGATVITDHLGHIVRGVPASGSPLKSSGGPRPVKWCTTLRMSSSPAHAAHFSLSVHHSSMFDRRFPGAALGSDNGSPQRARASTNEALQLSRSRRSWRHDAASPTPGRSWARLAPLPRLARQPVLVLPVAVPAFCDKASCGVRKVVRADGADAKVFDAKQTTPFSSYQSDCEQHR